MKVGEIIVCKDAEALEHHMVRLLQLGYAIRVEFDKLRITVNEEPEGGEEYPSWETVYGGKNERVDRVF